MLRLEILLHRVNDIESHFPVITIVKKGNGVKHVHTSEDPNRAKQLDVINVPIN